MKFQIPIAVNSFNNAWNQLDYLLVSGYFAQNFEYSSQTVLTNINGKEEYLEYLKGKFETLQNTNLLIRSEVGMFRDKYCLLITQEISTGKFQKGVILVELKDNMLSKALMCSVVPTEKDITLLSGN